jgi:hypothetical protein
MIASQQLGRDGGFILSSAWQPITDVLATDQRDIHWESRPGPAIFGLHSLTVLADILL